MVQSVNNFDSYKYYLMLYCTSKANTHPLCEALARLLRAPLHCDGVTNYFKRRFVNPIARIATLRKPIQRHYPFSSNYAHAQFDGAPCTIGCCTPCSELVSLLTLSSSPLLPATMWVTLGEYLVTNVPPSCRKTDLIVLIPSDSNMVGSITTSLHLDLGILLCCKRK